MLKQVQISFPVYMASEAHPGWEAAFCGLVAQVGGSLLRDGSSCGSLITVELSGEEPDDHWFRVLYAMLDQLCAAYERGHPDRVMWVCASGFKPEWSRADAAFLGKEAAPDAPDTGEPTFDESVYFIEIEEREDFHCTNPRNPGYAAAQAERERKAEREREKELIERADRRHQVSAALTVVRRYKRITREIAGLLELDKDAQLNDVLDLLKDNQETGYCLLRGKNE